MLILTVGLAVLFIQTHLSHLYRQLVSYVSWLACATKSEASDLLGGEKNAEKAATLNGGEGQAGREEEKVSEGQRGEAARLNAWLVWSLLRSRHGLWA